MSFEKPKADLEEKGLGDHVIVLNESSATVTGDSDRTARAIAAQVGAHPAFPGYYLILIPNRCMKQKLRSIIIYEFSLFESKQKAQKGEMVHGFIGCRCTEWYRG